MSVSASWIAGREISFGVLSNRLILQLSLTTCRADSIGERSTQYAAESSCRLRFGNHAKWIGQFDIDEYFVPMGDYTSVLPLLAKLDEEEMKIISFASWRAWPRRTHIK